MDTITFPANENPQTEQKKISLPNICNAESYFKRNFFKRHYEYEYGFWLCGLTQKLKKKTNLYMYTFRKNLTRYDGFQ